MVETYPFITLRSPPLTAAADFHRRRHDHRRFLYRIMPLKDLTLRRITRPSPYRFGFSISINTKSTTMADQPKNAATHEPEKASESIAIANKDEKGKAPEKSTPATIPPPPEKPEPGDCCGSGCVRCVWDAYYEELEEYNKLYDA